MKILMVNKFHYRKGGSETYYFSLRRRLEEDGHTVVDFSMQDERNFPSPYADYFVRPSDYANAASAGEKLRMAANIVYSTEAKRKFEALVQKERPDLVHLHVFQHQLSPSILDVCKKYDLPTVYTAHDLKMVCLNYKMMHHGRLCEDCRDGRYFHCVRNRCVKDSALKSGINYAEGVLHRARRSYDAIDFVLTPSRFYRDKLVEFGVAADRVVHIPNFLDGETPTVNVSPYGRGYYLYFGRLVEEKGVGTLINAFENTALPLVIVGTGPLEDSARAAASECGNITLAGFRTGQELTDIVGNAKAVLLPSEWYENGPYSAIEALRLSRPLIGADIGGIPELIDGNGFLFPPRDVSALRRAVEAVEALGPSEYEALERRSSALFDASYRWERHAQALYAVYRKATEKHGKAISV